MHPLPTDPAPYAEFIVQHLMQPVCPDGRCGFAVAETEHAVDGDRWFWADDNAKVLEFMALPALWRRFPGQVDAIFRFVDALCDGAFIFRRTGHPRLERIAEDDGRARFVHTFMHVACDLPNGVVEIGMRFHDGRTARNVILTGNYVQFDHDGIRHSLDVEEAVADWNIDFAAPILTLRHASELRFLHHGRMLRLGRLTYTYTLDARSMFFDVAAELDLDAATPVSGLVLTIGHDNLSHNENGVHYGSICTDGTGSGPAQFDAAEPGHTSIAAEAGVYWSMAQQDEMRGFALGVHSIPEQPERLSTIEAVVKDAARLHYVVSQYRFPEERAGGRIRVAERKIVTSGGFYGRVAECSEMLRRHATEPSRFGQPLDLSISYDYGAEIAAFARCHRALSGPDALATALPLKRRSRALFDRFHAVYAENLLAAHRLDRSAIFSRPLAFVALGLVDMRQATGEAVYTDALRQVIEILLDFERPFIGLGGTEECGFIMGQRTNPWPYMDCHAAALLALIRALPVLEDARLAASISRGLGAFGLATVPYEFAGAHKVDVVAVDFPNPDGGRFPCHGFWNFCAGLTLRSFKALRRSAHPALHAIAAEHRVRLDILQVMLEQQVSRSLRDRDGACEILTSHLSAEGNSETQPWVALGLVADAGDE